MSEHNYSILVQTISQQLISNGFEANMEVGVNQPLLDHNAIKYKVVIMT